MKKIKAHRIKGETSKSLQTCHLLSKAKAVRKIQNRQGKKARQARTSNSQGMRVSLMSRQKPVEMVVRTI